MPRADWIAVDWGTTRLRAWAMGPGDRVLAEAESADGMGALDRDGFEPALLSLIEPWLGTAPTRVIACGMVGARQGWVEATYRQVPCRVTAGDLTTAPAADPRLDVRIAPGLCQAEPADVMRGEETQIAGFLHQRPGFDGVLCLPGTHTKWARIADGRVAAFRTAMTGEMFAVLSAHSVLRHSVGEGWSDVAFDEGIDEGAAHPAGLARRLFGLRAASLLHGLDPGAARARLSGLLIGMEIADTRALRSGREVVIIGAGELAAHYARALGRDGAEPGIAEAAGLTLAGLIAIRTALEERP